MTDMVQILVYMAAFYLILKAVEILQLGLASRGINRKMLLVIGLLILLASLLASFALVALRD